MSRKRDSWDSYLYVMSDNEHGPVCVFRRAGKRQVKNHGVENNLDKNTLGTRDFLQYRGILIILVKSFAPPGNLRMFSMGIFMSRLTVHTYYTV
jgi:hypothetical protein